MAKTKRSKKLDVISKMPPLRHSVPGKPFDVNESETVRWLIGQSDVLNYLWGHVRQLGYVTYDSETGKWRGVDYGD